MQSIAIAVITFKNTHTYRSAQVIPSALPPVAFPETPHGDQSGHISSQLKGFTQRFSRLPSLPVCAPPGTCACRGTFSTTVWSRIKIRCVEMLLWSCNLILCLSFRDRSNCFVVARFRYLNVGSGTRIRDRLRKAAFTSFYDRLCWHTTEVVFWRKVELFTFSHGGVGL